MKVVPPGEMTRQCPPDPPEASKIHPLLTLSLGLLLATATGLLISWEAAAVFISVVGLISGHRQATKR